MRVEVGYDGICLTAEGIPMGTDLCVVVTGGDTPHLGCAVLGIPHPGISDPQARGATASVLNLPAHRDDALAVPMAKTLSCALDRPVAVLCGVHFELFSLQLARAAQQAARILAGEILNRLGESGSSIGE